MALVLKDRVKETSTTTGTGTFTLAGAATGFQSFSVIGNGNTTYYSIVDSSAGTWEVGIGTYTSSGTTLSRDTVLESSNSGSLVNFGSGSKDVFVTYPAEKAVYTDIAGGFPSGTVMLFVQTSAPTGWTKSTTHNDKALRVVSGTAGTGGSVAFTTAFASQTPTITTSGLSVGATTLTVSQIPSHTHTALMEGGATNNFGSLGYYASYANSGATGGGGSHTHSLSGSATSSAINLAVSYVDVIIATKD